MRRLDDRLWRVMSIILGFITLVYIGCLIVTLVDRSYAGALFFAFLSAALTATTVFTWVSFARSTTVPRSAWTP